MSGVGSQEVPILPFILSSFALSIWTVVDILKSKFRGNNNIKWILAVTFLPIIGVILYYTLGVKQKISPKTHYNCHKCREFILREANTCNYCGCKLFPDLIRNKTNYEIEGIWKKINDKTKNISNEYIISCPYCHESIRSDSIECTFCAMFIPEEIRRNITTDNHQA
jgi:hypothetical protein